MGGFSVWHWLIVGLVVLLLFGKGRFSDMMGDVAKGLKSFKKGMTEDEEAAAAAASAQRRIEGDRPIEARPATTAPADPVVAPAPPSATDRP